MEEEGCGDQGGSEGELFNWGEGRIGEEVGVDIVEEIEECSKFEVEGAIGEGGGKGAMRGASNREAIAPARGGERSHRGRRAIAGL